MSKRNRYFRLTARNAEVLHSALKEVLKTRPRGSGGWNEFEYFYACVLEASLKDFIAQEQTEDSPHV